MFTYRGYTAEDLPFLREMLFEAVFWHRAKDDKPTLEEGLSHKDTRYILEDFGTGDCDLAMIAELEGEKVGAIFMRCFSKATNMRGYISDDIPVLVIGVSEAYRRQGVGKGLIDALKNIALIHGMFEISLCVSKDNIAYELYKSSGFKVVSEIDGSYNMLIDLS